MWVTNQQQQQQQQCTPFSLARASICFCTSGVSTQPGQDPIEPDSGAPAHPWDGGEVSVEDADDEDWFAGTPLGNQPGGGGPRPPGGGRS